MKSLETNRGIFVVLVLTLTAFLISSCGITASRSNDGYANLDSPGISDTNRTMSLSLGKTTLRFAARFLDDEPETQALLRSLDGVRVRIYEVTGDTNRIAQNFEHMGSKLSDDGWQPIMLMREEGELVQMFSKSSSSGMHGLTIVSADDEEVVVVNVMGDIQPEHFGDVMVALDVDNAPDVQIAAVD
ncbi:MAG: DUF4252 domain-containing protein [Xanthomonadales bacterium]|nr:DUF4252 domain-containing protein [Xanthomonadales bacterium]